MSKQILVLKTSLVLKADVEKASMFLNSHPQIDDWNVDLEDCDKVLRIVCDGLTEADIAILLYLAGYDAEKLN